MRLSGLYRAVKSLSVFFCPSHIPGTMRIRVTVIQIAKYVLILKSLKQNLLIQQNCFIHNILLYILSGKTFWLSEPNFGRGHDVKNNRYIRTQSCATDLTFDEWKATSSSDVWSLVGRSGGGANSLKQQTGTKTRGTKSRAVCTILLM